VRIRAVETVHYQYHRRHHHNRRRRRENHHRYYLNYQHKIKLPEMPPRPQSPQTEPVLQTAPLPTLKENYVLLSAQ
jgi:hypothetical protein